MADAIWLTPSDMDQLNNGGQARVWLDDELIVINAPGQ